ncbi:MAG TPA: hypothetical protein VFW65_29650 [Pseudonocardiaceae bacterium]|nr:hypothetical protein [Pseudonocardiaceae bacterium]
MGGPPHGRRPLGPVWGAAALLARYGACPIGAAAAVALIVLPDRDTMPGWLATVSTIGIAVALVIMCYGFVAIRSGIRWRSRGRAVRGVTFLTDEPEPVVRLDSRTRFRQRPLRDLRAVEVHRMAEWVDDHEDRRDRDRPPWLRLDFGATRYCLLPIPVNATHAGAMLAADLRAALAGTAIHVEDVHTDGPNWRTIVAGRGSDVSG